MMSKVLGMGSGGFSVFPRSSEGCRNAPKTIQPRHFINNPVFFLLFSILLVSTAPCLAQQRHIPYKICQGYEEYLKTVLEGCVIEHTFQVRNIGSNPLRIKDVQPGRGCEVVTHDAMIPPGSRGKILIRISTTGSAGKVLRRIVVHSDDPVCPRRILGVTLQVTPAVSVRPNRVFLKGFPDEEIKKAIRIQGNRDVPLALTLKSLDVASCVTFCLQRQGEKNSFLLEVKNTQTHPGTYRGRFLFETNEPLRPVLAVPVFGRIMEDVQVIPKFIDFGTLDGNRLTQFANRPEGKPGAYHPDVPTKTIFIRLNRGECLEVKEAFAVEDLFDLKTDVIQKGRIYRIRVRPCVEKIKKDSEIRTAIVVKTNDDSRPQIEIPLTLKLK